jgi:adenylate cyclase
LQDNIRILAAVMFTDIAGFTTLMQENEQAAKERRDRCKNILESSIAEHYGRILQHYGDGTLSIFGSAVQAAKCAVAIQRQLQKEPVVPLRIGIHLGDIVYNDDGVYGDSVNVASRVESLAVPGSVLVSEKVHDELRNQHDITSKSIGFFELKNVRRPMEVFVLTSDGLVVPSPAELKGKTKDPGRSIAVLPFINMSPDPDNEYFSDGMTEEIINALTKVDGLHVTSRTSSFAFKGQNLDVRELGSRLNVGYVIEGSVRKAGERVRITAQLINVKDGYHFWSHVFDRRLEDIFALQDEISHSIVDRLSEKFELKKSAAPLVKAPTKNLDAYNLYLKGIFYWNKWTHDGVLKAVDFFKEAIELESDFAAAYAWLSNCYILLGTMGFDSIPDSYNSAKKNALKSLELDPTTDVHVSLAMIKFMYEWDLPGTYESFQTALKLNPGSPSPHYTYAFYLLFNGDFEQALSEVRLAVQLDPLSLPVRNVLANTYFALEMYEDAIAEYNAILEMDRNYMNAYNMMAWCYFLGGEAAKAVELLERWYEMSGNEVQYLTNLGFIYAQSGRKDEALKFIERLKVLAKEGVCFCSDFSYAVIYNGLGDFDNAFHHLGKAAAERNAGVLFSKFLPIWKALRQDPRYNEMLKKAGLIHSLLSKGY